MAQTQEGGVREAILQAAFRLFCRAGLQRHLDPRDRARGRHLDGQRLRLLPLEARHPLHAVRALAGGTPRRARALAEAHRRPAASASSGCSSRSGATCRATSNGFANNMMQALSTSGGNDDYSPHLRELFQGRVARWMADCLTVTRRARADIIAGVVLMAFDGFAMNVHLEHGMAFNADRGAPVRPDAGNSAVDWPGPRGRQTLRGETGRGKTAVCVSIFDRLQQHCGDLLGGRTVLEASGPSRAGDGLALAVGVVWGDRSSRSAARRLARAARSRRRCTS